MTTPEAGLMAEKVAWQTRSQQHRQGGFRQHEPLVCRNGLDSLQADDITIIDWDDEHDPENPYNWSTTRKWLVTGVALLGTLLIPLNGTGITVAASEMNTYFNVSDAGFPNSYWIITSWSMGGAIFIIFFLPLMEDIGIRLGFIVSYVFFILMIIPQALAQNYATLIVTRFFSGGCVALLSNTISSVIPDVWADDRARSIPVGFYIVTYLAGSTAGPPVFAGVMQYIGDWRWIFYIQLIMYGALSPLFYFFLRETRGSVILRRRAALLRKNTGKRIHISAELDKAPLTLRLFRSSTRPIILLATEPVLAATTVWSAFCVGTVYLFTQSVAQVFTSLYHWPEYTTGYVLGAVVIGEVLGWVPTLYSTRLYFASSRRNTETPGTPIPEARLYLSVFGSFLGLAGGMFLYAWTSYPSLPWIAPAIGLTLAGVGIQVVVTAAADYITDIYAASGYAGSAISAVAAGENVVAAFLPLAASRMYTTLGFQWASTLLGLLALVVSLAPVVFIIYGRRLRERSPYMQSGGRLGRVASPQSERREKAPAEYAGNV